MLISREQNQPHDSINTRAREIFERYPDHPILGIYNIETHAITLIPCIREKVWLVRDKDNKNIFASGWYVDENMGVTTRLNRDLIPEYNRSGFMPRVVSNTEADLEVNISITGHELMLERIGEVGSRGNYRGFTVINGDQIMFDWKSGALNSPYDAGGKVIRTRGAKMEERYQVEVMGLITPWWENMKIQSNYIQLVNLAVYGLKADGTEFWAGKAKTLFGSSKTKIPDGIEQIRKLLQNETQNPVVLQQQIRGFAVKKLAEIKDEIISRSRDDNIIPFYQMLAGGVANQQQLRQFVDMNNIQAPNRSVDRPQRLEK